LSSPSDITTDKQTDGSVIISGKGAAGATITVSDATGKTITSSTLGSDGTFKLTVPKEAAKAGQKVTLTQVKGDQHSQTITLTMPADQPTNLTVTVATNGHAHVAGKGTPGSTIYLFTADGDTLAAGRVGNDGSFDVQVPLDNSKAGTVLAVVQATDGGLSTAIGVKVPSTQPTGVVVDNQGGNVTVSGHGQPGSTVAVTDTNGHKVATGTVGKDGSFTITVPAGAIKPGQTVVITQTTAGTDSNPITITVPSEQPGSIVVKHDNNGVTISGTGKPGAIITIKDGQGHALGTTTIGSDGHFTLTVPSTQLKPGDKLYLTSTHAGVPSKAITVTVPAKDQLANGSGITAGNHTKPNAGSTHAGTGTTTGTNMGSNGHQLTSGTNANAGTLHTSATPGQGTILGSGNGLNQGTHTVTGNGITSGTGVAAPTPTMAGTGMTAAGTDLNAGGGDLQSSAANPVGSSTGHAGALPQTDDNVEGSLAVAGTIMLGLVGLLGARQRREELI